MRCLYDWAAQLAGRGGVTAAEVQEREERAARSMPPTTPFARRCFSHVPFLATRRRLTYTPHPTSPFPPLQVDDLLVACSLVGRGEVQAEDGE